jgi:hypothetical protein
MTAGIFSGDWGIFRREKKGLTNGAEGVPFARRSSKAESPYQRYVNLPQNVFAV